ncbi:hypothetical protein L209DRAFT_756049, partial [Thermothelomyces heterothallicus CBS 203.75]
MAYENLEISRIAQDPRQEFVSTEHASSFQTPRRRLKKNQNKLGCSILLQHPIPNHRDKQANRTSTEGYYPMAARAYTSFRRPEPIGGESSEPDSLPHRMSGKTIRRLVEVARRIPDYRDEL